MQRPVWRENTVLSQRRPIFNYSVYKKYKRRKKARNKCNKVSDDFEKGT